MIGDTNQKDNMQSLLSYYVIMTVQNSQNPLTGRNVYLIIAEGLGSQRSG